MKKIKTNPAKTILTITVGFLLIYLITKWKWSIAVSLGIGIIGILSNYLSQKIEFLWMKLSWLLGLIIPNIVLGIIFYLFLFPLALLSRAFGRKDPLYLKNKSESVFKTIHKDFEKSHFEKSW